jgi:rubrerythrin
MISPQLKELLLQSLEHERGGVLIYRTALECAVNPQLRDEWESYLDQTANHVNVLTRACESLGLDPGERTPSCEVVHDTGKAFVLAMKKALASGDLAAAELVACECVVLAETKDHLNWELLSKYAEKAKGAEKKTLTAACEEVEEQEDEHIYHSKGWCRELWIQSLGMPAVLPPPEEEKKVKTAIGAARAEKAREEML